MKRQSLISNKAIFYLTVSVVVLLLLLQPNKDKLLTMLNQSEKPDVAIAFLSELQRQHGGDITVSLSLAHNYSKASEHQHAMDMLLPISKFDDSPDKWNAWLLFANTQLNLFHQLKAQESSEKQHQRINKITDFINQLPVITSHSYAKKMAKVALQIDNASLALNLLKDYENTSIEDRKALKVIALQCDDIDFATKLQQQIFQDQPVIDNLTELLHLYAFNQGWQQGENAILAFKANSAEFEEYYSSSITFLSSAGKVQHALELAEKNANKFPTIKNYTLAARLAVQGSKIKTAKAMMENVLAIKETPETLIALHQYNRWLSDTPGALIITHKLLKHQVNESILRNGLAEASALADLHSMSKFYGLLVKHDWLKKTDVDNWLDTTEKARGAIAVVKQLESVLTRKKDPKLFHYLSKFYQYLGRGNDIIKLWPVVKALAPINYKQSSNYAEAFKNKGYHQKALSILIGAADIKQANDEYIAQITNLAWYVADKASFKKYQPLSSAVNFNVFRFLSIYAPIQMADFDAFRQAYLISQDSIILEEFAAAALIANDGEKFNQAIALSKSKDQQSASMILLLARAAIIDNKINVANDYLQQILKENPNYTPAVSELIWLTINQNNYKLLSSTYEKYKRTLGTNSRLWPEFAAASNALSLYRQSKYWYTKLIKNNRQSPLQLLEYSSVLENSGDLNRAYKVRAYVASQLTKKLFSLPQGDISFRSLIAIFVGNKMATVMAEKSLVKNKSKDYINELTNYYLSQNQSNKIQSLQLIDILKQFKLSSSQSLQLALQRRDSEQILNILNSKLTSLAPVERMIALAETNQNETLWQFGNDNYHNPMSAYDRLTFTNQLASIHPKFVNAARIEQSYFTHWDIEQTELAYFSPAPYGYFRLFARQQQFQQNTMFQEGQFDAYQLEGIYGFGNNKLNSEISLIFDERLNQSTLGYSLTLNANPWQQLGLSATLEKNTMADSSQYMFSFGKQDLMSVGLNFKPNQRESISLELSYQKLKTIFDQEIATNKSFVLSAEENIFYNNPAWFIYGRYIYEQATFNDVHAIKEPDAMKFYRPFYVQDFITDKYQKVSIGQRFEHGIVSQPGAMVPGSRYWLDTAVHFNMLEQQLEFSVNSGFGLPVFGNDELFMKTHWQSADKNGKESLNLSIGYFLTF